MLIPFLGEDNILDSNPFLEDEVQFNLLHLIRQGKSTYLSTNEKHTVIIGQSTPKHPAWIWTADEISDRDLEELKCDFVALFRAAEKLTFVAKPDTAILLAEHFAKETQRGYQVEMKMEAYHCPTIVVSKQLKGNVRKAGMDDTVVISEFLSGFVQDCFGSIVAPERYLTTAATYVDSGNLYILCDKGMVVSMANIAHRSKRHARINEVYTRTDMRGLGYGGRIVSELCRIILAEHRVPVLYTDLANPSSNKAYKNVGFIECGEVTQIIIE